MKSRDDLLKAVTDLGTITDDVERRARLTALADDLTELYNSHDTLSASNAKFEADNKKLQEYNMKLFLRVGGQQKQTDPEPEKQADGLKYENLFNEEGELK